MQRPRLAPEATLRVTGRDVDEAKYSLLFAGGLFQVPAVCVPAAPKVIETINAALGLPDEALELTWRSLSEIGNISSASVLHVLRDTMAKHPPSGSPGVLMAMGPGFCSEVVLLRWH